jgi:hypothetical protein
MEILGYAVYGVLIAGFGWALVDLLIRIHKQPKRPLSMLRMTSYPFVPDDEILERMREKEDERKTGKLQPSPVPVRSDYR